MKRNSKNRSAFWKVGVMAALLLSACSSSVGYLNSTEFSSKKVQTTENLLRYLSEGFERDLLGKPEFYRRVIGYKLNKLPKNWLDPEEFGYGTGEAVRMDEGDFYGNFILTEKWLGLHGERIMKIKIDTPGCLKQWQVEEIFSKEFTPIPESAVFGVRPENWPVVSKISQFYDAREQIVYIYVGERDKCLLSVSVSEIHK
ncbi:hypothetical protein [Variovorax sp. PAMC26660]|uniref:hypothetical protein n=1 Tax=Variovorax sp. PAMC26660 TaxID=2762322 RepID=UPI00164DE50F|nr:hypothetical protein [Variovorax sp. PAMC26660]QNK68161.1 hypothetical protein H7F35_34490 [Variovorax sp. PAMC26660]